TQLQSCAPGNGNRGELKSPVANHKRPKSFVVPKLGEITCHRTDHNAIEQQIEHCAGTEKNATGKCLETNADIIANVKPKHFQVVGRSAVFGKFLLVGRVVHGGEFFHRIPGVHGVNHVGIKKCQ